MGALSELQIELSGLCNAACVHCAWQRRSSGKQLMDAQLAHRLLVEAKALGLRAIRHHGVGEPLLHPQVLDLVRTGESLGLPHSISTNCYLLAGELAAGLRVIKGLQIVLAIPWVMPDVFVDRCVENVLAYLPADNRVVYVQLICHEQARQHYRRFVDTFLPVAEKYPNVRLHLKQPVTWPDSAPSRGFVPRELLGHAKVTVDARSTPFSLARGCDMPERFLMVTADGLVVPCCVSTEDWGLGALGSRTLREVWLSPAMRELRERWRSADSGIPCGRCRRRTDC